MLSINKYVEKYNPKAIFLKGSKMLGISSNNSDTDIEILVDTNDLPKSYKEDNIDIFFINKELKISVKKSIFEQIVLLQYLFLKPEHILYKSEDFDFSSFKELITNKLNELLFKFIEKLWINIRYYSYKKTSRKNIYHICYISSLVDNSLPNWEIIQRLKEYTENVEDLSYYEECRKKLLNFYFKYLRRLNEIF
ncbi:hypothetical protein PT313_00780 [Metamycoplasma hyosynoviae]|uniref:Polymerase nucleotidyl transferase domain-containing protein n=4 Tax=Metamycoplasma hyosynoviae TaxID=29559 RepID=A0A4R7TZS1_9BACT|nr:hypothetical protein [Metamycoplasma hyosynoviae]MDC8937768.1 hypothetical protein [Metamycoplasma hyosynoviae]MDD1361012.1 hypothetical protein [Metamycoplasma hyosynoviae]MDD1362044.1 hypothetical protein [Metamycoplasma hyosynoviae]MDD1374133.1 hypothetical protein [Metamycoplasma hyosynoviae]MDD7895043.1 hypothetical protein [Metamycoplasma hyosynoviae]